MIYDEWVFHDVEHIYLQLIKKLRCAIYSGQLSAGEKIPICSRNGKEARGYCKGTLFFLLR